MPCYARSTVATINRVIVILACAWSACAQTSGTLKVLSEELDRNFQALKKADPAPYFLSYAVTDQDYAVVAASFGSITSKVDARKTSNLDVTLRVGSPQSITIIGCAARELSSPAARRW